MAVLTNDTAQLEPKTEFDGPRLEFDFPALQIGVAEYEDGPTGCTVFYLPAGALTAIDIRGGAPGTMVSGEFTRLHAICFAGGSFYGLEAASGVAAELFAMRDYSTEWGHIALVSGAIINDFGGPRNNAIYPDKALGRAALKAARSGVFPLRRRGAGASAAVGKLLPLVRRERAVPGAEWAGQGGAFRQIGETKIAVFSVVNAMGAVFDREGRIVRGNLDRATGERRAIHEDIDSRLGTEAPAVPAGGNTTLTVLVTNQRLRSVVLTQLGRQAHSSMARAIQPFHTPFDGDVFYAATTNEVSNDSLDDVRLGVIASELAWDAVLSSFDPDS